MFPMSFHCYIVTLIKLIVGINSIFGLDSASHKSISLWVPNNNVGQESEKPVQIQMIISDA